VARALLGRRRRRPRAHDQLGPFAAAGTTPSPVIETNSVSTLIAHARSGLSCVAADTWLLAHPLPPGMRAVPLVDPVVEYTIGLVASGASPPSPMVAELLSSFAAFELDPYEQRVAAAQLSTRSTPV
jgi:DNA-binding transcriptional LysR family regulator